MEVDWEKLIPKPKSRFVFVECVECGHKQVIFDSAKIEVKCQVCGSTLALPRGGKAKITGKILERLS